MIVVPGPITLGVEPQENKMRDLLSDEVVSEILVWLDADCEVVTGLDRCGEKLKITASEATPTVKTTAIATYF